MIRWMLITLLSVFMVTASGCIGEKKAESTTEIFEKTMPQIEKNVPEISIDTLYITYNGDNLEGGHANRSFNFSEQYYIAYGLIIKNNGVETVHFSLDDLQLLTGDLIFTPSSISDGFYSDLNVWSSFEQENQLKDTILPPAQMIKGTVVFNVQDYEVFSDRSFTLQYGDTPVNSPSFNESLSVLTIAECYDYSTIFRIPPYTDERAEGINYYWIFSNWVNRSIFEHYRTTDPAYLSNETPGDLPLTKITYGIKVIPKKHISVFQDNRFVMTDQKRNTAYFQGDRFYMVDDQGIEISNTSIMGRCGGLAIREGQDYHLYYTDYPQMNFSNVTVVQFSFNSNYGWGMAMRMTFNNQDIILDDHQEIVLARYDTKHFVS